MSFNKVTLLLGTNLGDRIKNIDTALSRLQSIGCVIEKKTKILNNPPVEFHSYNNFCNIAVLIRTELSPIQLLKSIKEIEREMGRTNDSRDLGGYIDRIIDIDIVMYNGLKFQSKKLEIPHCKNLYERDFSMQLIHQLLI